MTRPTPFLACLALVAAGPAAAGVPAAPVMTLYRFNGPLELPYYDAETFRKGGGSSAAGTLSQGSSVIPCLVVRDGRPVTDDAGTPFVGFEVVVDSREATPAATDQFKRAVVDRRAMTVENHHCGKGVRHVLDVRNLYAMAKAPFFEPPVPAGAKAANGGDAGPSTRPACRGDGCDEGGAGGGQLDAIVRAFHNSPLCAEAGLQLVGRRAALDRSWARFTQASRERWPSEAIEHARHLDYTMRTALFEGHLDRGCSAYGACERDVIALSIRNRGREACAARQGCSRPGDFQGVASAVSQYNIWDEFLTQVSGLTSCYLRQDLGNATTSDGDDASLSFPVRLQRMHEQSVGDVERILFGDDEDLRAIFPGVPLADLKALRHYYHAPAMGKCFPDQERVEYVSGAVAAKGKDFVLIANSRIVVGDKVDGGYRFRELIVREEGDRDLTETADRYPGFVIDGRKVTLKRPADCAPYGIPPGCLLERVGRYRKTPSWLTSGRPIEVACRVRDRGEGCRGDEAARTGRVGGTCDKEMRPVAGVP